MLQYFFLLLFIILNTHILYSQEHKLLFVGHAYGSPSKPDQKIDPYLSKFLKSSNYKKIIFGGDFIQNCNDSIEINNFFNDLKNINYELVLGNHDDCQYFNNFSSNRYEIINGSLFIYLNTNFKNELQVQESVSYVLSLLEQTYNNVLIFSHQLIFSKSVHIKTNSEQNYDFANGFYSKILPALKNYQSKVYLYSGDIGAFYLIPFAYFKEFENITLLAVGLGNGRNNKGIQIKLSDKVENSFIDLVSHKEENLSEYSHYKVLIYQSPRVLFYFIKKHFVISILFMLVVFYLVIKLFKKIKS